MRLLSTSKLEFREFHGSNVPFYAILSHTWGEKEVSLQDMQTGDNKNSAGFTKIKSCCDLAASEGWEYVWIDTCCIDKTSSAELSEAINSMFEWYRDAQVCYAYLADVSSPQVDRYDMNSAFRQSRWFTRGWTLQELLAPAVVVFYNQNWVELGTKSSLSDVITTITRIARSDMTDFKDANVAVKMSWASSRQTTRMEDTAYSLLGLFGVNMPLLYGEGRNAFIRLQLEILRTSDDETIFAWESTSDVGTGLLAPSPAEFYNSGDVRQVIFDKDRPEYSMTNKGLRITLLLGREILPQRMYRQGACRDVYLAPLNCTRDPDDHPLAIYLEKDEGSETSGVVRRSPKSGVSLTTIQPMQNLKESAWVSNLEQASMAKHRIHSSELGQSFRRTVGATLAQSPYFKSPYLLGFTKRHTVYVKQLDSQNGGNVAYRPRRFLIKYPLSNCTISEVRLRSGLAGWEEGESEECAIWLDSADEAALIVFDVSFFSTNSNLLRSVGQCSILLRLLADDSARTDLAVSTRTMHVSEFLTLFKGQRRTELPKDRISRYLRTGISLSVKLRPEAVSGEKQFSVTLYFDPSSKLFPWPPTKTILTTAKHVDDQEDRILDQIQGYALVRPS